MNSVPCHTAAQTEAITTGAVDVLAVAGPGSGKTRVLVERIKYAIEAGVPSSEIAVLTFTNAAAREIAERLTIKAHENGDESMPPIDAKPELGFVGTLHSFALRILREHGAGLGYGERLSLIAPESSQDLLASKSRALSNKPPPMERLLALKAEALARPGDPRLSEFDLGRTIVATFREEMRAAGVLDYDMLLQELLALLTSPEAPAVEAFAAVRARFTHLFVDEVQDSAPIDWAIYKALPAARKFYVGDPDQAIYGFRGGRVAEMLGHALSPGVEVIRLEENFRSGAEICAAAQRLIGNNAGRLKKETRAATRAIGEVRYLPTFETDSDEIAGVAREIKDFARFEDAAPSIAVLARTNAIAADFRRGLAERGVPVSESKRAALPPDFRVARAFLELCHNPENDALAMFYLIARAEHRGEPPAAARMNAHKLRTAASAAGESLNHRALKFSRITRPDVALEALAGVACRETRAIAAERFRELQPGASVLDLALALASMREFESDEGEGVRVLTMHSAKGREFDAVFVVGFEDEAIPGRAGKGPAEGIEEERRLAYVAATRARALLVFSWSATRNSQWARAEPRKRSRFVTELQGAGEF